ncbi:hypothetical protein PFHG_04328 [Plasmodium falciparum HB3]|uniref:Uncharacterized protein n=1 Tax=Plasmodium falciparum (isolate HB3) TaxID=137071 RepID=A0A0L7KL46_PLAFX|nr:hypothetical protein PFHG_04328 [Plasmodium falciparum HB3]
MWIINFCFGGSNSTINYEWNYKIVLIYTNPFFQDGKRQLFC